MWCEADSVLLNCMAAIWWRGTISGILEAAPSRSGLKVEGEDGF